VEERSAAAHPIKWNEVEVEQATLLRENHFFVRTRSYLFEIDRTATVTLRDTEVSIEGKKRPFVKFWP
jgi:hypothetical protein